MPDRQDRQGQTGRSLISIRRKSGGTFRLSPVSVRFLSEGWERETVGAAGAPSFAVFAKGGRRDQPERWATRPMFRLWDILALFRGKGGPPANSEYLYADQSVHTI